MKCMAKKYAKWLFKHVEDVPSHVLAILIVKLMGVLYNFLFQ